MRALQLAAILAISLRISSAADQASQTDIWQNLEKYVAEQSKATGSFGSSLSTAYYGSNALGLLESDKDIDSAVLCPLAEKELEKDSLDLKSASLAAHVLKRAKCGHASRCPKAKGSAAAEKVARQALGKEVPDAVTGYAALSTLSALGKKASASEIKNALVPLAKQQAGKGRLKTGSKGSPSLMATACGYLAGAEASSMGSLDSDSHAALEALVSGIPQVLESASRSSFWSDADDDALEAVALFLKGIDDTCSSECSLSQQQLGLIAQHLLRVSDVGSIKDAHHLLQGIVALSGNGKLPKAAVLSLKTPAVAISEGVVAVALHYMKGTPTEGQELTGTIIKGKKATPRELRFTAKGAGQYEASLPTADMLLGTHQLTVTATGKSGETVASETLAVALVGMVEVTSAVLSIKRLDPASTKQKEELEYPQQLQKPLHLQPGTQLKALFTPTWNPSPSKGFVPQQAFVSLKSRANGKMVVVAAKAGKDGAYTASLTPEIISNHIGTQAGEFDATLTVADDGIAQAVLWPLGTVNVSHASAAAPTPSAAQLLNSPKPEIHHIFQAPGRRPAAAVSMAFTVLSVAPLGFLLIYLSKLGVNLKGFPTDGPALLNAMAFHCGVAGILVLYFVFWVRLTLIDMLLPLLVLSVFTFYFGFLALKRLAKVEPNLKQE